MNSPFANLLLKLQTYIPVQVPAILFIDNDFGQFEMPSPPVTFPAILVDFPDTVYKQLQQGQDAACNIQLRIGVNSFENTSNLTPALIRQSALEFFDIEQAIYEALQTYTADGLLITPMIRTGSKTERRNDGLRIRVLSFKCTFWDNTVD